MKKLLGVLANPQAAIIKAIIKILTKQFKLDNLSKVFKYVEEDNELDKGLRKVKAEQEALKNMVVAMARYNNEPPAHLLQEKQKLLSERMEKLEEFQKKIQKTKAFKKLIHKL